MTVYVMVGKSNQFKEVFRSVGNVFSFLEAKNLHAYNTIPTAEGLDILAVDDSREHNYCIHLLAKTI